ncbi:hypothetical protein GcM1_047002, partial [Golovinomyces cichoracearum]
MFSQLPPKGKALTHQPSEITPEQQNQLPSEPSTQENLSFLNTLHSQKQFSDKILTIESQINAQTNYINIQIDLIQKLQQQLDMTERDSPNSSTAVEGNQKSSKEKLTNVRKVQRNRAVWDEWHLAASNKLTKDGPAIGDPFDQFMYIYARLDDEAARMVSTTQKFLSESATGNGTKFL